MTSLSGKRVATAALLVLVFGAGGFLGFVVGQRSGPESGSTQVEEARGSRGGGRGGLVHRLDLSEDQRAQVDSILEHHRSMWADLQREIAPRHREIVERTQGAIRSVLTPEQEVVYDSLLTRARERRRSERDRRRDGG